MTPFASQSGQKCLTGKDHRPWTGLRSVCRPLRAPDSPSPLLNLQPKALPANDVRYATAKTDASGRLVNFFDVLRSRWNPARPPSAPGPSGRSSNLKPVTQFGLPKRRWQVDTSPFSFDFLLFPLASRQASWLA